MLRAPHFLVGAALAFGASTVVAQSPLEIQDTTSQLPAGYVGVRIDSLLAESGQPPKGEYESTYAYHQRLGIGRDGPLVVARIPVEDSLCGPMTRYDADAGRLKVALTQIAGVIGLKCGGGIWGVSAQDLDWDAIAWVPLGADTAEQTRNTLSYWLAFRVAPTIERGAIWRPFPTDSSVEGIVTSRAGLWVADQTGRIVHKEWFEPLPADLVVWAGALPTADEQAVASASMTTAGPPTQTIQQACQSPDRVAAVTSLLDAPTLYDLRAQLRGLQMNGDERNTTWEQWLSRAVAQRCNPATRGAYPFQIPPDTGTVTGTRFGCTSRGDPCTIRDLFVAPYGYQICTVRFRAVRSGKHMADSRLSARPDSFEVSDPSPARFRAVRFYAHADGQADNKQVAQIKDTRIFIVRHWFDVEKRRSLGCDFPTPGAELVSPPPAPRATAAPSTPTSPARVSAQLSNKRENAVDVIFANSGGTSGSIGYRVMVFDGDDNTWKVHETGTVTINPNSTFIKGMHKWRAKDWQLLTW